MSNPTANLQASLKFEKMLRAWNKECHSDNEEHANQQSSIYSLSIYQFIIYHLSINDWTGLFRDSHGHVFNLMYDV